MIMKNIFASVVILYTVGGGLAQILPPGYSVKGSELKITTSPEALRKLPEILRENPSLDSYSSLLEDLPPNGPPIQSDPQTS